MEEKRVTVSADFYCHISQEIMFEPVVADDGETYERECIEEYFEKTKQEEKEKKTEVETESNEKPSSSISSTSPQSTEKKIMRPMGIEINNTRLVPNRRLNSNIKEFLTNHPEYWEKVYFSKSLRLQCLEAVQKNDIENLKRLSERDPRLLTRPLSENETLIDRVCKQKEVEIIKFVVERLRKANHFNFSDEALSVLLLGCSQFGESVVKAFIEACGWEKDKIKDFFKFLIEKNQVRLVRDFIESGLVKISDAPEVVTFIIEKLENGDQFILSNLSQENIKALLTCCAEKAGAKGIKRFITACQWEDEKRKRFFITSIEEGQLTLVNAFIDSDVFSVNGMVDEVNNTPLHLAAFHNQELLAKYLIDNGANEKIQNAEGNIPEKVAEIKTHYALAKHIVEWRQQKKLTPVVNEIEKLKKQTAEKLTVLVENYKNDINKMGEEMEKKLNALKKEHTTEIESIKREHDKRLELLESKAKQLDEEDKKLSERISGVSSEVQRNKKHFDGQVESLEKTDKALSTQINFLKEGVGKTQKELQNEIKIREAEKKELEGKITELGEKVRDNTKKIDVLQKEYDLKVMAIEKKEKKNNQEIESLKALRNAACTLFKKTPNLKVGGPQRLTGHTRFVTCLAVQPDGTIVSGSDDNTIKLWKDGKCIQTLEGHTSFVRCLALQPDRTIVSGSKDNTIKLWKDGKCIQTLIGHEREVMCLAVQPDGAILSGSFDGTVKRWKDGQCIQELTGHGSVVRCLALQPDGTIVGGSYDKTIRLWKDGKCIQTRPQKGKTPGSEEVTCLAVQPDGTIVSGSNHKTIRLWKDGKCIQTLGGHTGIVTCLAVRSDGTIVSGSDDNTIKLWKDGKCIQTLEGKTTVRCLALQPDGTIVSSSEDNIIKLWIPSAEYKLKLKGNPQDLENIQKQVPDCRMS